MTQPSWGLIRDTTRRYLVDGIPGADHSVLFNAFPGSGKTFNVLEMLMEIEHKFIYLGPNHEVINENLTFHGPRATENNDEIQDVHDYMGAFVHFKGRRHVCEIEEYRRLSSPPPIGYNMPIKPLCATCVMRDNGCEYYMAKWQIERENPPSWAGVHSHITTYLRSYLLGAPDLTPHIHDFDVLVIEESPLPTLMEKAELSRDDMVLLDNELATFPYEPQVQVEIIRDVIDFFLSHITRPLDYERMLRIAVRWQEYEWDMFKDLLDSYIVARIMQQDNPLRRVPKDCIKLLDSVFRGVNREILPYRVYSEAGFINLSFFHTNILHDIPIRIIGLDGTANIDIWRRILAKEVDETVISTMFKNIYQMEKYKYPQRSWIHNGKLCDTGATLLDIAEKVVRSRKSKTLLIGTKKLKECVEEYFRHKNLGSKIEFAWYYNLRSNNFLQFDTVILLNRPSPPPKQLEIYSALSWPNSEQMWIDYFTRDEMLQAMARIRPNLLVVDDEFGRKRTRDKVETFIFSSEDMLRDIDVEEGTFFKVDKYTMKDLVLRGVSSPVKTTKKEIDAENSILELLSDTEERTQKDIIKRVSDKMGLDDRIIKRMVDRLRYANKIYYIGGKYGLVG